MLETSETESELVGTVDESFFFLSVPFLSLICLALDDLVEVVQVDDALAPNCFFFLFSLSFVCLLLSLY